MPFTLPDLPDPYEALQPYLSKETLEFHHDKHHAGYVTTANNLLKDSSLEGKSLEEIAKEPYGKMCPCLIMQRSIITIRNIGNQSSKTAAVKFQAGSKKRS